MIKAQITQGDCLHALQSLPPGSIDLVLADPPYGVTSCKWDTPIDLPQLWGLLATVCKPNAAIVMFCAQPFTSTLIESNKKHFRYCWVWDKQVASGMTYAKYQPMRRHEDIAVFYKKRATYNRQMVKRDKPVRVRRTKASPVVPIGKPVEQEEYRVYTHKNPTTILRFPKIRSGAVHPTQKPVPLLQYLIKTYTDPGQTVLDFSMGSGSTGVAALQLDRHFVGIEKERGFFETAQTRTVDALRRTE